MHDPAERADIFNVGRMTSHGSCKVSGPTLQWCRSRLAVGLYSDLLARMLTVWTSRVYVRSNGLEPTMTGSQDAVWNGPVGDSWVRNAVAYDRLLEPLGLAALARLDPGPGECVLDVGCGTGATTLDLGRRVGLAGSVVGVDVSRPMIEQARARRRESRSVDHVDFRVLDVEHDELPGPFDVAFSRLGVMFFEHPEVAFARIASSLEPHGRLVFVCFASPAENLFITVPTDAALAILGGPGMPSATSAGPFSLADPRAVRELLAAAGFGSVDVAAGPDVVTLGPAEGLATVAGQALEQNPLVMARLIANPDLRRAAVSAAPDALSEHVHDGEVRLAAATWIVEAVHARM